MFRLRFQVSSQDEGIGRQALLPCTTKRRITNDLKLENNQNCQKIKLYGSLRTSEYGVKETFIQTGRRGRDGKPGWTGLVTRQQAEQDIPHSHAGKLGRTTGDETDCSTQGASADKESLKTSGCKNL